MARVEYATVGSNDLQKAKAFYDALFARVGIAPAFEHPSGGRVYAKDGIITFGVLGPYDRQAATPGNGTMISFRCESPAEVDIFHAQALGLGGKDEGAPGWRAPQYYMSYFRDLDGNKLCAYAMAPGA
jgi:predicted lactoylglutathione lyase